MPKMLFKDLLLKKLRILFHSNGFLNYVITGKTTIYIASVFKQISLMVMSIWETV